jgi:Zn finger protein HypA/HybF involved in hydrogenase expression
MQIQCTECSRKCGEIRDASLLKGLKFICPQCESKRIKAKADKFLGKGQNKSNVVDELFGMFGGK